MEPVRGIPPGKVNKQNFRRPDVQIHDDPVVYSPESRLHQRKGDGHCQNLQSEIQRKNHKQEGYQFHIRKELQCPLAHLNQSQHHSHRRNVADGKPSFPAASLPAPSDSALARALVHASQSAFKTVRAALRFPARISSDPFAMGSGSQAICAALSFTVPSHRQTGNHLRPRPAGNPRRTVPLPRSHRWTSKLYPCHNPPSHR